MTFIEPKSTIYAKLSEITTVAVGDDIVTANVRQQQPDEIAIEDEIMIIFRVSSNVPIYCLDKTVANQDIVAQVDIYGLTSLESGAALVDVETKMREINYFMVFNIDITDPKGYSHITAQFKF